VCIRCHRDVALVRDACESWLWSTESKGTLVFCAVDGNPALAAKLIQNGIPTYCSPRQHGWGTGLFELQMESVAWLHQHYGWVHTLSVDYDTLAIGRGADAALLGHVTSDGIGLVGKYRVNANWARLFGQDRARLSRVLGPTPPTYVPGEGLHGSCTLLTVSLLERLSESGLLQSGRQARRWTGLPDDHLLPLVCKSLGLSMVCLGKPIWSTCKPRRSPRGAENEGYKVFHPVLSADRDYFQRQRVGGER